MENASIFQTGSFMYSKDTFGGVTGMHIQIYSLVI